MKEEDYTDIRNLSNAMHISDILKGMMDDGKIVTQHDLLIVNRKVVEWRDAYFKKINGE